LKTGFHDAYYNMGLDEAVLESVSTRTSPPTLRFYGWKPSAISLGYFQGLREEVDTEACASLGIDVVRRITGGGAVFHDAEVTYSIIIPETHPLAPGSILESYRLLCSGIIAGLDRLGIEAEFAPINDIISNGRKISGNAQTRKMGCLLQHGTILISVDVEKMFQILKVPREKAKGRLIEDVKARVTSLEAIMRRTVAFDEVVAAVESGFSTALDLEYTESAPTGRENEKAASLANTKFSSSEWIGRR
jgi:lipoate-protein ligase A